MGLIEANALQYFKFARKEKDVIKAANVTAQFVTV